MNQVNEVSGQTSSLDAFFWKRLYNILIAALTVGLTSYLVAPMLPIYCVESIEKGGLGWSRMEACSLYGTYLAAAHVSPFIGGILADFIIGRFLSVLLGYALSAYGFYLLWFFPSSMLVQGFLAIALGTGCIKVSLAAAIGKICSGPWAQYRAKAYEYHYFVSCAGFIAGNFFSNLFFDLYGMKSLILAGFGMVLCSIMFYLLSYPKSVQTVEDERTEKGTHFSAWGLLAGMMTLSTLFFLCGNQLNSSISLFIHQEIDRSCLGWNVPTLWFSVFGFIVVTAFTPLRTKLWKRFEGKFAFIEPLKMAVGFLFLTAAFCFFALCAFYTSSWDKWLTTTILLIAMGLLFMSDVHVRPLLFSSATKFSPPKYQTLATAVVYSTIGFGGKVAGWAAGTVDIIGFHALFSCCALLGSVCFGACLLLLWYSKTFSKKSAEAPA